MPFRWLRQNKPFGLCIHPVINGYSRRILWLEDRTPNNDSRIVARYLLDCVKQVSGVPRCVLGDRGTENVYICALQHFFWKRWNRRDGWREKLYIWGGQSLTGPTPGGIFYPRMLLIGGSINLFKDLRNVGLSCDDDPSQEKCVRSSFMPLTQEELNHVAQHWTSQDQALLKPKISSRTLRCLVRLTRVAREN